MRRSFDPVVDPVLGDAVTIEAVTDVDGPRLYVTVWDDAERQVATAELSATAAGLLCAQLIEALALRQFRGVPG